MTRSITHGFLLATCVAVLAACSPGESANAPEGSAPGDGARRSITTAPISRTLNSGTQVDAALTDAISSRSALAGDAFVAQVVEDVRNAEGVVVIPAGSAVHGTITEVSPAANTRSVGTLTLAVSSVTVSGTTRDLDASIDALETVHEERGVEKADVARVAGGAAAGAILGRVIGGNTKGAIFGGAVGAVAGTAVTAVVRDMDIVLPAGAHLMLSLRSPFTAVTPR